MKKEKDVGFLWVLWSIITIVAISHLIRAVAGWSLTVETFEIPIWFSYLVFAVIGYLSYRLFMFLKK